MLPERKRRSANTMRDCLLCGQDGLTNLDMHLRHKHQRMSIVEYRKKTWDRRPVQYWTPQRRANLSQSVKASYTNALRSRRAQKTQEAWNDPILREQRVLRMREVAASMASRRRKSRAAIKARRARLKAMTRLRRALERRARGKCERCRRVEAEELRAGRKRLHLHHLTYARTIPRLKDVLLLCGACHKTVHNEGLPNHWHESVARAVTGLLGSLRINMEDENFIETPRRYATYLLEHFTPLPEVERVIEEMQNATFPDSYDEIIAVRNVEVAGMCPHHLLPIRYTMDLAYIPNGQVIGLSKLARIADLCGRLPLLQETVTAMIADRLKMLLRTDDVAVLVRGEHLCMTIRGPRVDGAKTSTSALFGVFRKEPETRAELMALLGAKA